jgi:hypothetical protein
MITGNNSSGAKVQAAAVAAPAAAPVLLVQGVAQANRSGTIATGGTAQQLMAANADRKGFTIQNLSTSDLWWSAAGTAAPNQPSYKIAAGMTYETPALYPLTAVSIYGATTGQAFSSREY